MNIKNLISVSLQFIIYFLILLLLLLSPLPLGSVQPWAKVSLQVSIFTLAVLWLIYQFLENNSQKKYIRNKYQAIFFFGFLAICVFQVIPLPEQIIKILSGESLNIWNTTQGILEKLGYGESKNYFTISLYPYATWKNTILLISYFAFGFIIADFINTRRKVKFILFVVLITLTIESIIGIYQYITNNPIFFEGSRSFATGTYFNRNHYIGFIELTLPLFIGFIFTSWRFGSNKNLKSLIKESDTLMKSVLFLFLVGIAFMSLLFSLSRMGIFSFLISLIFFYLVYKNYYKNINTSWFLILIIFVGVTFGLFIGLLTLFERFVDIGLRPDLRFSLWTDSFRIFKSFPLFGTGLATFEYVFQSYRTLLISSVFNYTHNDYLQLLFETGLVGFGFIITSLTLFFRSSIKTLNNLYRVHDDFGFFICLGALTGIVSILIHSLADFNLHIPANAIYFSLLVGLVKSTSNISEIHLKKNLTHLDKSTF